MKGDFQQIIKEYNELQAKWDKSESRIGSDLLKETEDFIRRIGGLGRSVSDPERRSQLKIIIRYWKSRVFSATNKMPGAELEPFLEDGKNHGSQQPLVLGLFIVAIILVTACIAQVLLARPAISLESPTMGQRVYCVSGVPCLTKVSGTFKPTLLSRIRGDKPSILPMVRPSRGGWYPQTATIRMETPNNWASSVQLGDTERQPARAVDYELVALAVSSPLILDAQHPSGPIRDYNDLRPVAVAEGVTITAIYSAASLLPEFGDEGVRDFAFSRPEPNDYFGIRADTDSDNQSLSAIHLTFSARGQYAGWSVERDKSFDASRYRQLRLNVRLEEGNFEIKLEDSSAQESALLALDYLPTAGNGDEIIVPLQDFVAKNERMDLSRLRVLTIGFNKDYGNVTVSIRKILFE